MDEAIAQMLALARGYFGREVDISPRAAAILLSPGEAPDGSRLTAFSDDILTALVRQSPCCALAMMEAGFDVDKLLAVGVRLTRGRWRRPNDFLFSDLFGHDERVDEVRRVGETGRLDEVHLLTGLLQFAMAHNAHVRKLLVRTLRHMHTSFDEQRATAEMLKLCERVLGATAGGLRGFLDQQWAVVGRPGSLRLVPFAPSRVVRFVGDDGASVLAVVAAVQSGPLFAPDAIQDVERVLNERPSNAAIEDVLVRRPELHFTLAGAHSARLGSVLCFEAAAPGHVFLQPLEHGAPQNLDPQSRIADALMAGLATLDRVRSEDVPLEYRGPDPLTALLRVPALILGQPPDTAPNHVEDETVADLHLGILPRLSEYHRVRELDFDEL